MTAIFGPYAIGELFFAKNGLLISKAAEERLDDGKMVLVPAVSETASTTEITTRNQSEPKELRIKYFRNPDNHFIKKFFLNSRSPRLTVGATIQ